MGGRGGMFDSNNANAPATGSPGAATGPPALEVPHDPLPPATPPATTGLTPPTPAPPPVIGAPLPPAPPAPISPPPASAKPLTPLSDAAELAQVKQAAIQGLEPLVDKLDQTPEQKFHLNMMLAEVTANPHLIKQAYEAANQIKDDKIRAQALYDIISAVDAQIKNTQK